jgi:hypothetical protein
MLVLLFRNPYLIAHFQHPDRCERGVKPNCCVYRTHPCTMLSVRHTVSLLRQQHNNTAAAAAAQRLSLVQDPNHHDSNVRMCGLRACHLGQGEAMGVTMLPACTPLLSRVCMTIFAIQRKNPLSTHNFRVGNMICTHSQNGSSQQRCWQG